MRRIGIVLCGVAGAATVAALLWPKGKPADPDAASLPVVRADEIITSQSPAPVASPEFGEATPEQVAAVQQASEASFSAEDDTLLWRGLSPEEMRSRARVLLVLAKLADASNQPFAARYRVQAAQLMLRAGEDPREVVPMLMQALEDPNASPREVGAAMSAIRDLERAFARAGESDPEQAEALRAARNAARADLSRAATAALQRLVQSEQWRDDPGAFPRLFRGAGMLARGSSDPGAMDTLRILSERVADQSTQPELAPLRQFTAFRRAREASQAGDWARAAEQFDVATANMSEEQRTNPRTALQRIDLLAPGMGPQAVREALASTWSATSGSDALARAGVAREMLRVSRSRVGGEAHAQLARSVLDWMDAASAQVAAQAASEAQAQRWRGVERMAARSMADDQTVPRADRLWAVDRLLQSVTEPGARDALLAQRARIETGQPEPAQPPGQAPNQPGGMPWQRGEGWWGGGAGGGNGGGGDGPRRNRPADPR